MGFLYVITNKKIQRSNEAFFALQMLFSLHLPPSRPNHGYTIHKLAVLQHVQGRVMAFWRDHYCTHLMFARSLLFGEAKNGRSDKREQRSLGREGVVCVRGAMCARLGHSRVVKRSNAVCWQVS